MDSPSTVHISLTNYGNNLKFLKRIQPAGTKLIAVIKANAYGHGLKRCALTALEYGADVLGICDNDSAHGIRSTGIILPILRLRPALLEEARAGIALGIEEMVSSLAHAEELSKMAMELKTEFRIHIHMSVGMNRMSFYSSEMDEIVAVSQLKGLQIVGISTHFACADDENWSKTVDMKKRFDDQITKLLPILPTGVMVHCANSAATLRTGEGFIEKENVKYPHELIRPDLVRGVRVGIVSYGYEPSPGFPFRLPKELQPVMSWETRIVHVKDAPPFSPVGYSETYHTGSGITTIATVPVGYCNGYPRILSSKSFVVVGGIRCRLIGRVSMNVITINVTSVKPRPKAGDIVVLMGEQMGSTFSCEEFAKLAATISYEISCDIGNNIRNQVSTADF